MMLSRWARAACDQREIRKERLAKRRLVWVEAIMIEEITAHFPNFAELLVGITVEGLELARVDEGVIVVVHVVVTVPSAATPARLDPLSSLYSIPPEYLELNAPSSPCSYAFVEFRSSRDAEDAYYDMYA